MQREQLTDRVPGVEYVLVPDALPLQTNSQLSTQILRAQIEQCERERAEILLRQQQEDAKTKSSFVEFKIAEADLILDNMTRRMNSSQYLPHIYTENFDPSSSSTINVSPQNSDGSYMLRSVRNLLPPMLKVQTETRYPLSDAFNSYNPYMSPVTKRLTRELLESTSSAECLGTTIPLTQDITTQFYSSMQSQKMPVSRNLQQSQTGIQGNQFGQSYTQFNEQQLNQSHQNNETPLQQRNIQFTGTPHSQQRSQSQIGTPTRGNQDFGNSVINSPYLKSPNHFPSTSY